MAVIRLIEAPVLGSKYGVKGGREVKVGQNETEEERERLLK